jgi:hypothetical protein
VSSAAQIAGSAKTASAGASRDCAAAAVRIITAQASAPSTMIASVGIGPATAA